jgi:hypothetical protein
MQTPRNSKPYELVYGGYILLQKHDFQSSSEIMQLIQVQLDDTKCTE